MNPLKKIIVLLIMAALSIPALSQQHYPIRNMLGVNIHQWDAWYYDFPPYTGSYDAKYKALVDLKPSSIRVYMDADSEQDSSGNYAFDPSYRGGFRIETGIKRIKASNPEIFMQACYQRQTPLINKQWADAGAWYSQLNFPYKYNNDVDRQKPSSYATMGHDLAVIATRGGRNTNGADYPVFVDPNWWAVQNQMIKGQNFWDAVEGGNEWNAWWGNYNTNLNSKELAAAWVCMGDSVKGADATMLFTNGGVADDKPDTFLKAVDWWTKHGYKIPIDYYSYHSYPDAEYIYGYGVVSGGLNPEELMGKRAAEMIKAIGSTVKVVIGEWGYDVHPMSVCNAPAYGNYSAEQTRGNWSVRAMLKFAQAGIYRAQWYRAYQDQPNDVYDNDATMFSTMAWLRQLDNGGTQIVRTLVGDYCTQMNMIGDYVFDEATRDDSIQVLRFKNGAGYLYALWKVEKYTIADRRPVYTERKETYNFTSSGTRYDLNEDGSGVMRMTPFYGGNVELTAKPFFIATNVILPIKKNNKPPAKPKPHVKQDLTVYNINGQKLLELRNTSIEDARILIKSSLKLIPGTYIISSKNTQEKFLKLN